MSWLREHRDLASNLLELATRAPSSHNTQPWIFRFGDNHVELVADRTRALPVNDPDDRELVLSCGAALLHLRVAARHLGLSGSATLLPEPGDPDLLARVDLSPAADDSPGLGELAEAIALRRTYRQRFAPVAVVSSVVDSLCRAASEEKARLVALADDGTRRAAASLVAEGDAELWANPSWRRELAAWMHPRRRGDGITVPGLAWPVAQWVVRSFDMGGGIAAKDQELAEHSPLLAVLTSAVDEPRSWLEAGQALARVLLTACRHGLQASYLNQPIQVASLRPKLAALAEEGMPQVLLRFGYPSTELPPSPRRPIEVLVEWDDGAALA